MRWMLQVINRDPFLQHFLKNSLRCNDMVKKGES